MVFDFNSDYSSLKADIDAIFEMKHYSAINPGIANKCLKSMRNHCWYFYPSIISFCFIDPEVCDQGKEAVAQKIYAQEATESEGQGKVYENLKQTT